MHAIRHAFAAAAFAAAVFAAPLMAHAAWDQKGSGPHPIDKSPQARAVQTGQDSPRSLAPKPGTAFSREFVPNTRSPAVAGERAPGCTATGSGRRSSAAAPRLRVEPTPRRLTDVRTAGTATATTPTARMQAG